MPVMGCEISSQCFFEGFMRHDCRTGKMLQPTKCCSHKMKMYTFVMQFVVQLYQKAGGSLCPKWQALIYGVLSQSYI